MSAPPIEAALWSTRQWFAFVAFLALGQIALIVALTQASMAASRQAIRAAPIRMVSANASQDSEPAASRLDPTLFALVHPDGFSGSVWLRLAKFPYRSTNFMHPPRWLEADPASLASGFTEFIGSSRTDTSFALSKPNPIAGDFPSERQALILRPFLRIEGDIASRRLVSAQDLPPADPDTILSECIVSVILAPHGDFLSATVTSSSGSPKTDEAVLVFVRTTRFVSDTPGRSAGSAPRSEPFFGRLVFQWLPESPEDLSRTADR